MISIFVTDAEQYSQRTRLRITKIPSEKDKTSEKVLEKVKKLLNKAGIDIPDSNIDRAHCIGTNKKTGNIVNFPIFRHRTSSYRVKKKLKTGA